MLRIMRNVSATDFIRNFPTYREMAKQEPVPVTDYGRVAGYFISVSDYEELERGRRAREVRSV
jgi:PHD/YefM family antitoxin component YafN of YafNO toxin-antitoxin module